MFFRSVWLLQRLTPTITFKNKMLSWIKQILEQVSTAVLPKSSCTTDVVCFVFMMFFIFYVFWDFLPDIKGPCLVMVANTKRYLQALGRRLRKQPLRMKVISTLKNVTELQDNQAERQEEDYHWPITKMSSR
ncbi:uncharacterized protein LOC110829268 [Zootermopsis nevadensis]|uniref:uncharacterized protein LOC110829268 n=1 Tax=Zootermopsis nevadensis TaxID=136037 RepID=UPI000B8E3051|nr:uncharacterized protein LOC110829268 [Zootermopsis nevadensis]